MKVVIIIEAIDEAEQKAILKEIKKILKTSCASWDILTK